MGVSCASLKIRRLQTLQNQLFRLNPLICVPLSQHYHIRCPVRYHDCTPENIFENIQLGVKDISLSCRDGRHPFVVLGCVTAARASVLKNYKVIQILCPPSENCARASSTDRKRSARTLCYST